MYGHFFNKNLLLKTRILFFNLRFLLDDGLSVGWFVGLLDDGLLVGLLDGLLVGLLDCGLLVWLGGGGWLVCGFLCWDYRNRCTRSRRRITTIQIK